MMNDPPTTGPPAPQADRAFERQLREMNEVLLVSSVRQHELAEQAQKAEAALQEIHAELQANTEELNRVNDDLVNLLGSVQMAIVMLGPDLRVRRFTPAAEKLLNLIPTDVGRPLADIKLNLDNLPDLEPLLAEVLDTVSTKECDVCDKHGRWYSLRLHPYKTLDNKIDGVVVVLVDVDAMKRAHAYTESIVATVREPLLVLDKDLRVRTASRSFYDNFHVTPEDTANRPLYELGHGQWDNPDLRRLLEEVLPRDNQITDFEVEHQFEHLGTRMMLLNARRLIQATDQAPLILLAIEDVTERKLAEAQIKNVNANLAQKNRELAEFVHTVSHDLKSPLVTIGGMLGLLKEELQEERLVAAGEFIATAEETVVGMRDMIDDLLKLSRIGTVAIDLQPVGLRQVAEEFVRKHAPELEDKGTAVSLELSEDQPTVLADRNRLVEVLDNLMVNALKYACDGPEPRITIGSETVGREVRLFVKDNGPGIGKQDHEKIFGLFQRLDENKEGTGVGLAIVKRIMEVHGGRVWVESAIGEGATFWLAFPAAVGEAAMSLSAQGRRGRA